MLKEKHKIVQLLDELLQYSLEAGPQKVVITVEDLADQVQITLEEVGAQRSGEECRQAERFLNAPRRNELQDYYGGLAGEESCGPCNLRVVGMMVDGGRLEQCKSGMQLSVWWQQE